MCIFYHTESDQLIAWSQEQGAWILLEDWAGPKDHFPGYAGAILIQPATGQRTLALGSWGLTPAWVSDANWGRKNANNARSETLDTKPAFREAFLRRRCVVPMSWFFERGERNWVRYRFKSGEMMMAAGLYEEPNRHSDKITYTVATTDSNPIVAEFNDRMPVFLTPSQANDWLDPQAPLDYLRNYLQACPNDWLEMDDGGPILPPTRTPKSKPDDQGTLF